MYIITTEFGDVFYAEKVGQTELEDCEDGGIDIVDVENLTRYIGGDDGWMKLEAWESWEDGDETTNLD